MTTGSQRSDTELLRRGRKDSEAFRDFYRLHADWVYRWFVARVGDPQLAADLTSETFAQALVSITRFRGTSAGSGTAWLFGIARNLLYRTYERRRLETSARERLGMPVRPYVPADYEEAEERLDALALTRELAEALGGLTPELREALELRVVEGLSYHELAAAVGTSAPNARVRVSRALRALAGRLTPSQEEKLS